MAFLSWVLHWTAWDLRVCLLLATPLILLVLFLVAFIAHSIITASPDPAADAPHKQTGPGGKPLPSDRRLKSKVQRKDQSWEFSQAKKRLFIWLSVGTVLTFVGNAVIVILHALLDREHSWWCGQSVAIYVVSSFFVYSLVLVSIIDTTPSPTEVHWSTWIVAAVLESTLLAATIRLYASKHREPSAEFPEGGKLRNGVTKWEAAEIAIDLLRIILLSASIAFYALFVLLRKRKQNLRKGGDNGHADENTSLLNGNHIGNNTPNGHAYEGVGAKEPEILAEGWSRPIKVPSKSWWEYIRGYGMFFPYLWPSMSVRLQLIVMMCFALVMVARVVNLLVPYQVGVITDKLSGDEDDTIHIPWSGIFLYIFYRVLQGNNGLLGAVRSALWIPISQYSYQELSTAAFEHVHSLSLDFHLGKKTGEVLSALSKGNSINTFVEQVTFQVIPMLIDLVVAIGFFLIYFDAYYGLVVAIIVFTYLYLTIRLAQWRAEIRREMVNASRQEDAVKNDSMVSYETVKYFNAEQYEFDRYRGAVRDYQKSEYTVLLSLNVMNVSQNLVFTLGLMIICLLAAYQVSIKEIKVGKFVSLLTYMAQLQGPLNFFGTFYRSIQSAMINSERMLELFKERPTVVDEPLAQDLPTCQGEIHYNDVEFAYDPRKPALSGVTFRCPPGTTTALVGESGGGKSTIFRLLYRFYNTDSGSIQIDGHDVKDLTIDSLRRHIGVVPQDTVLFNETIMYNLRYANPLANDEDVYTACRAASIHEKILTFPDGYNSRVGDRGLKLSGGERQRVAIARTILKDPRIILLDEATAALDSETEQHIQNALDKLSQGRTTLVIAHRLSTITRADQILVLHAGQVVESGTHDELLVLKGRYASMWRKQIRAQMAAEQAKGQSDRPKELPNQAQQTDDSGSQSEDDKGRRHDRVLSQVMGTLGVTAQS